MPKVSEIVTEGYINLIRKIRARRPYLSVLELQKILEQEHDMKLHYDFLRKLFKDADDAARKSIQLKNAIQLIAPVVERLTAVREVLWSIIENPKATDGNKVYAAKTLMENDKMLMDAIYDSGLLQKDLGKLEVDEFVNGRVTNTDYSEVAKTMQNFGLLSQDEKRKIDRIFLPKNGEEPKPAQVISKDSPKRPRKKVVR